MRQSLPPLVPEDWPHALQPFLETLKRPLNIYGVLAHHERLLLAWAPLRRHIVRENTLTPRQLELVVLRNAVNTGSEYEWRHHVDRGRAIGLTGADFERLRNDPDDPHWTSEEALLLKAVDELNSGYRISPQTWLALSGLFEKDQLLDMLCTVGMYMTLACIANTCDVPIDDWLQD